VLFKNNVKSLNLHVLKLKTTGLDVSERNSGVEMERIKSNGG